MPFTPAFIARWSAAPARERAHYQQFFVQLCDALDVPQPDPSAEAGSDYCFEKPVTLFHPDGRETTGRVDFYRKGCFVLEAKHASGVGDGAQALDAAGAAGVRRGTPAWAKAMRAAFTQARRYATNLPGRKPPFILTCDIGHVFEVWSDFTETGSYGGYGARRTIPFGDLAKPEVQAFFRAVFLDPPPSILPATRPGSRGRSPATSRTSPGAWRRPGTRRLPSRASSWPAYSPCSRKTWGCCLAACSARPWRRTGSTGRSGSKTGIALLWNAMDKGLPFGFEPKILRFNGGLFASPTILSLSSDQLRALLAAAKCDWSAVEPAIFGTLLERALDQVERAALGAHFTPRAYIERLVRPTIIEPLQNEWVLVQAQVRLVQDAAAETADARARRDRQEEARSLLLSFLNKLCQLRVLDPACGTGNFLYVSFILLKGLEEEVRRELEDLGTSLLELRGVTVNPSQFLGIERNVRAREIADLVLWIGYLQWYRTARRGMAVEEPVLRTYENVVARDAVLTWSRERLKTDDQGRPLTAWDGRTTKPHVATGEPVPDESARVPVHVYDDPKPADWPDADFIVGNPPFVGLPNMRQSLGTGYVDALRAAWPDVPQTTELVMYWWEKAALMVRAGRSRRFGFITTNSITGVFNRKILEKHLCAKDNPLTIAWAIPDHPWVDAGADVRIAMTVGVRVDQMERKPVLGRTTFESPERGDEGAARDVEVRYETVDAIHPDLRAGVDITGAARLRSNSGMCCPGVKLHGVGFIVTPEQAASLGLGRTPGLEAHICPYLNGRDLAGNSRGVMVIDLYGMDAEEVRSRFPEVYQWVHERVKPERDAKAGGTKDSNEYASFWWLHGKPRPELRKALAGLPRYIATPETARRRWFVFLDASIRPDNKLVAIASDDAFTLGVLSSRIHVSWALRAGGRLGVGNDPIYTKSRCFDPFPFPDVPEAGRLRIRDLADQIQLHRERVRAAQADATLTHQYAALDRWREALSGGSALDDEEHAFHDSSLIGILASLHDDLDTAVATAYGWPAGLPDDEILARLVALNRERAAEEAKGVVRWLRPSFQAPATAVQVGTQMGLTGMETGTGDGTAEEAKGPQPWPREVPAQLRAVRDFVLSRPVSSSVEDVARAFRGARRDAVRRQLDTMEGLGILSSRTETGLERIWCR